MKRRLLDRIHDRAWREVGQWLSCPLQLPASVKSKEATSSISAAMPWADICTAFADETLATRGFRRCSAVRDIVETVGPVDGRFYAKKISEWDATWLQNPAITAIDLWGHPIRWPGWLLGTSTAFSPTTLRYLATALWLRRQGHLDEGVKIIEIGVGFGGLAAINALVNRVPTLLVDLPQVQRAALRMLAENGLMEQASSGGHSESTPTFLISNYAFTELSATVQNDYFAKYIKKSQHGMIISNAAIFARSIRGRSDQDLVRWFRAEGLPAEIESHNDLLSPNDHLSEVSMIRW